MILNKLRAKNFFSIGNSFLEIDIQKYKKTVITGSNGNGKSTINNAITFGLFKKTLKKVTISQMVNSINGKNCVVEIDLTSSGSKYLVRRGIKPSIFEIYKDDVLLDQTLVGDYQTFLEEKILKCSYRTFIQTSIISIENYVPFMALEKAGRREFIEDILDIGVFSTMNTLIKTKVSKNQEEIKLLDISLFGLKQRLLLQRNYIDELTEKKKIGIETLDTKISVYEDEIEEVSEAFIDSDKILFSIKEEKSELNLKIVRQNEINSLISGIRAKISVYERDINFFGKNTDCPTCRQNILHEHVSSIVDSQIESRNRLKDEMDTLTQEVSNYSSCTSLMSSLNQKESAHNGKISVAHSTISRLKKLIVQVNEEKVEIHAKDDIEEKRNSMSADAKEALKIRERQILLSDEQNYNSLMLEMFKDSGIKSKIVDQYIPIINEKVNAYLEKLDFFVSFNLNSEFVETIKSRHRDDFTYSSFSAGEKMRIDMSLLFTFRSLAKMRNSFSTNLLMLDEIGDSSTDSAGIDLLISILQSPEFDDSNLFVITHSNKDVFEQRFDGLYEVSKRDGFTVIKE